MGWFGSSASSAPPSAEVTQLEQHIQVMDMMFMRSVKSCHEKCIQSPYRDGELNKGESVCSQRCLNKFFDTPELVSEQLAEVGMQAQSAGVPM